MQLSLSRYFHGRYCFYKRCITHKLEVSRENFENRIKAGGDGEEVSREILSESSHILSQMHRNKKYLVPGHKLVTESEI